MPLKHNRLAVVVLITSQSNIYIPFSISYFCLYVQTYSYTYTFKPLIGGRTQSSSCFWADSAGSSVGKGANCSLDASMLGSCFHRHRSAASYIIHIYIYNIYLCICPCIYMPRTHLMAVFKGKHIFVSSKMGVKWACSSPHQSFKRIKRLLILVYYIYYILYHINSLYTVSVLDARVRV